MIDKKEGTKGYTESNSEQFFREMLSSVTEEAVLAFGQSSTPPGELIMTASGFMLRQELNTRLRRQAARLGVSLESLCHLGTQQPL
ncbi:hypothetical protein M5J15_13450 [Serratia symbiotica]|uniref:hypothetical protein n=1 Tax=Serratia symbiotica TaxID=138074 RepID=UPI001D759171|nr:hypothetical protein [Serratia symbiotica]NIG87269.1 hypothetical protein [Serratia symbiotica]USS95415.1 hypothetical protein M5J15_13450 [Serratia symbiotica]